MNIIDIRDSNIQTHIPRVMQTLSQGDLIIYPTDTSYGLGADATNEQAIQNVFKFKQRDKKKPLTILVSDLEMAEEFCTFSPFARTICSKMLPSPLTVVLPRKDNLPQQLTSGLRTIGIRIPDHSLCRAIVKSFGRPITATSANISGDSNLYEFDQILPAFQSQNKNRSPISQHVLLLNAGRLPRIQPSTIIEITQQDTIKLIRKGPVSLSEIKKQVKIE